MGTNYYALTEGCTHCGSDGERVHIGKSSAGWVFALNTHPEKGLTSLAAWKRFVRNKVIVDEYGQVCLPSEMWRVVERRSRSNREPHSAEFLERNHAVAGPNGLLRSKVDGRHCIAHGRGTWDLRRGEFS